MSDITIAGATFSDVTKIQIPKSGSGTAEFVEVSGSQEITQNDTYDVSALAQVVVNVSGGGGGASNVISGSFKLTNTGWTQIDIPYTGSGHPIAVHIQTKDGEQSQSVAQKSRKLGIVSYDIFRFDSTLTPTYNGIGSENANRLFWAYKSAENPANTTNTSVNTTSAFKDESPSSSGAAYAIRIISDTAMRLRTYDDTVPSYCFIKDMEYIFTVIYSS